MSITDLLRAFWSGKTSRSSETPYCRTLLLGKWNIGTIPYGFGTRPTKENAVSFSASVSEVLFWAYLTISVGRYTFTRHFRRFTSYQTFAARRVVFESSDSYSMQHWIPFCGKTSACPEALGQTIAYESPTVSVSSCTSFDFRSILLRFQISRICCPKSSWTVTFLIEAWGEPATVGPVETSSVTTRASDVLKPVTARRSVRESTTAEHAFSANSLNVLPNVLRNLSVANASVWQPS